MYTDKLVFDIFPDLALNKIVLTFQFLPQSACFQQNIQNFSPINPPPPLSHKTS